MTQQRTIAGTQAPPDLSDDELALRARRGDCAAFALLVERHRRAVYGLAYRLLGHPADAEDAAQETFVRAYTRLTTYTPDGRFSSWLTAICAHWCIDTLRARKRRVQTVALGMVLESDRFPTALNGPEAAALAGATRDEVQRWLDALPLSYRTVLALRYFQDLSYAEIADTLGESLSTIRMRLFRGRAMLQTLATHEAATATPVVAYATAG